MEEDCYRRAGEECLFCWQHKEVEVEANVDTMDISVLTLDDINRLSYRNKQIALQRYMDWVKKVRKQDRGQAHNFENAIYRFMKTSRGLCVICAKANPRHKKSQRCDDCNHKQNIYQKRKGRLYNLIKYGVLLRKPTGRRKK